MSHQNDIIDYSNSLIVGNSRGFFEMKRKYILTILSILTIFFMVSLSGCGKKAELRFGAGNTGGMYYSYAENLERIMADKIPLRIRTTTGSAANLRLLQKGFIDITIVQNDNLHDITGSMGEKLNFSAVCGLYTEAIQIVVRADSDIHTIEDLVGKKVSVGEEDSGTGLNAKELLQIHGLSFEDLNAVHFSLKDAAASLKDGTIDAFFYTAGAPTQEILNLAKDTSVRLLSVSDEDIRRMKNLYPDCLECVIPAGTYNGQTEAVHTVGIRAILLVSNDLDDETVRLLTETVFQNAAELNTNVVTEGTYNASFAVESIEIPFHPGAAAYFKTQGIEVKITDDSGSSPVVGGQDE